MKPVYFTVLFLVPYLSSVHAITISLVLSSPSAVTAGSTTTYNCTSEGDGNDPTLRWSIRSITDGSTIRSHSQLSSQVVNGANNPNDGEIKSRVTFTVTSDVENQRIWCGAIESGASTITKSIFTTIDVVNRVRLGAACSGSTTCTVNAGCVSNTCTCDTNFYDDNGSANLGGSCLQTVGLGSSCTAGIDASCHTANAVCSSAAPYLCECHSNFVQSGTSCIPDTAGYLQSCINPTKTCTTTNAVCTSGTCQCDSDYTYSSSLGYCIADTVGYLQSCINPTRSCSTQNAVCTAGTCQCDTGFTYSSSLGYCITSTVGYLQSCINPTRSCSTQNAVCTAGTCQCDSGFTYSSSLGYCITSTAGYLQSCINPTRSCSTTNAVCTAGTCQCDTGFTYSSPLGYCITSTAGNGESCINPSRACSGNNIGCVSGTCQCDSSFTYSTSLGRCITTLALVGDTCVSPTRSCITNAACNGATCACSSGYYQASTSSCVRPIVGQSCTTSVGCAANSGTTTATPQCSNSVCVCPSNYFATSGVCYIRASLGGTCNTAASTPCSDANAACTSSTCQCNSGYSNTNGNCIQSSTSTSCPSGTSSTSTVVGNTSPSTPTVTVGRTCYEVSLSNTVLMTCKDTKPGASALQSARWIKLPSTQIQQATGRFINGDIANPNLTVSNTESADGGYYICQLCYSASYADCTNSSSIQLIVDGSGVDRNIWLSGNCYGGNSAQPQYTKTVTLELDIPVLTYDQSITSSSASASTTTPLRGNSVTFTCSTSPAGVATSYQWLLGSTVVSTSSSYTISTVGTSQAGDYRCIATNSYSSQTSNTITIAVEFAPEPSGGTTVTTAGNFDNGDITITCNMNANPSITTYYFYDSSDAQLQNSSSNTYTVTSSQGYNTYSCRAQNSRGLSNYQYLQVVEESTPGVGAATENTGIGTGTIAAIVLGIIFLLLLIIIIIVCCCSYGWCRKKEKVEPQVIIEKPIARPYIPRTIVSASSTVSRKDVGVMVNGYRDASVSTDFEEPRYATPRYHLKRDTNGPIISIYDNGYEQPKAHQLPALDTQYLYTDNEPRKQKKKKRRRRRHEDVSPRRHDYEPEPDVRYAETMQASDDDLVVVPGKQNYFE